MRKSIAAEYFGLCMALITAAAVIILSVIIGFSVTEYKNDRRVLLERVAEEVVYSLTDDPASGNELSADSIHLEPVVGVNLMLIGNSGDVLVCSEASPCSHIGKNISKEAIALATDKDNFTIGTLGGYFDKPQFCLFYNVHTSGGGDMLLAYYSADKLMLFYLKMLIVGLGFFAAIMLAVYLLLKFSLNRILSPIKEMTLAAKKFGEGDFSEKVNISAQNEMGFLANTLNDMASSLEAIEENRKSFISNVSHELRTPMTTIGGFVDGILDGTIPESQHRHYLRIVSEEIDRLARLVRSMLNISKYEAGEMKLQTEDFDVTELSVKVVLLFEKRIEAKKVDIRGLDAERHYVNADKDLIQQVIYNLTENAVKFVNEGGYIAYDFRTEGDRVVITVRNSGEGLKKNEMNKVFDRFYKTDESRGKDKNGVGLGLSIVRSIIKLHEGSVLVRSKPGEYTEFEFSIPSGSPVSRRSE